MSIYLIALPVLLDRHSGLSLFRLSKVVCAVEVPKHVTHKFRIVQGNGILVIARQIDHPMETFLLSSSVSYKYSGKADNILSKRLPYKLA
jgi:hypothetical protein